MKTKFSYFKSLRLCVLVASTLAALASSAVTIPNTPLVTQLNAKPMVMLVAGKDHKMFYEAYNDASDIDGDGTLDFRFKPNITYYGLFDSNLCYSHNDKSDNTGLFTPVAVASGGVCSGQWHGNWLNYMTTSRVDAMRKVLYGGYREVDSATQTVLRRAYIPHDAHSWGKEYSLEDADGKFGFLISDYTPLAQPKSGTRHFFGTLTANKSVNCSTLNTCSDMPPLLRIRANVGDGHRIWEWASKERPVLDDTLSTGNFPTGADAQKDRTVRVAVCTPGFIDGCKLYPNGSYKPIGLLHEYGENDAMLFGLLSGSYDKHMSGGRLRKVVSSFKDEVDPNTGQFVDGAKIVTTFNNLRIRGFNQSSSSSEYWKGNPYADSAKAPTEGQLVDWGNPIGEMMYEATRYFAGKKSATTAFDGTSTLDTAVGLTSATWDDPYSSTGAAKAPWCAKASFLTISDVYPSFDSDQVPGSYFNSAFTGDITGLNVEKEGDTITAIESTITGMRFIGQSNSNYDAAPTAKDVTSLGTIRGLAPGEPAKQGSFSAASVAYFAKKTDLRTDLEGTQSIDTFVVALTSPLPEIKATMPNGKVITLVPFAKSVGGSGIDATKGKYQPTNQIVDFYVTKIVNSGPNDKDTTINDQHGNGGNGGRYQATFLINYEDVEQGGDHDMDAIARYEVTANADDTLSVTVTPTYQAGGMKQNMGYAISGTTADGVYLVAQDEPGAQNYFLNVPAGKSPGDCDVASPPTSCSKLPNIGATIPTFVFAPSSTGSASLLPDPLRIAAKYGGFKDTNGNMKPDLPYEWDSNGDGVPDTYFLVQNPSKLKEKLKKAFNDIFKTNSSASNVIANSASLSTESKVYQARFDASDWSGDLVAYPVTSSGVSTSQVWTAAPKLLNNTDRKLFFRSTNDQTGIFSWANLDSTDTANLVNSDVVDYLRGVRTKELQNGGTFRNRGPSVLGDIINSSPYYQKSSDVIFVGGNDGMLHAIKASDGSITASAGSEVFAFIPSQVLPKLKNLTSLGYEHDYFVDGDIDVSPKSTETGNKNILIAALGRGGKGLFALDVSDPANFDSTKFLWEYTPNGDGASISDGVADTTLNAAADPDLGYMLGRPKYASMKIGTGSTPTGAIIVGNGYNSTSGKAVLYVFLLDSSGKVTTVRKLDTGVAGDNGLSTPGFYDVNGNGVLEPGDTDFIYAGDLKGNVWKFDLSSTDPAAWSVALSGSPLFVAKNASNQLQPITAPITVAKDTVAGDTHEGKLFVFFGTGSYFQTGDPSNSVLQSWYGLIDENTVISARSGLVQRSIAVTGTFAGKPVRGFSNASTNDMVGKQGWYIDLNTPVGERMVTESLLIKAVKPALINSSIIPTANDACSPGGTGYVNAVNPFSGASLSVGLLDVNNNKSYADDVIGDYIIGSVDLGIGLASRPTLIGDRLVVGGTSPDATKRVSDVGINLGNPAVKGRISWREIIKD